MNYDRIRELCFENHMSLPELADKIGFSKKGIFMMVKNQTLTVEKLEKMCEVFKVNISTFFDDKPLSKIEQLEERLAAIEEKLKSQ